MHSPFPQEQTPRSKEEGGGAVTGEMSWEHEFSQSSNIKVAGYLKHSLMTSSNSSIVNISSPILHSYMIFTALILQHVIV